MGAVCCIKKNISSEELNEFNVLLNYSIQPITGKFNSKILKIDITATEINVTFIFKHDDVFKQLEYNIFNSIKNVELFKEHYTDFINKLCMLDLSDINNPKVIYCGDYLSDYLELLVNE